MGYFRTVPAIAPPPNLESSCLDAFDRELNYLFQTLKRMGVRPWEIEDLVQEIFVVLHRNWPTLDTTRPLRPYLFGVAFRVVSANRRRRARETYSYGLPEVQDAAPSPEASLQSKQSKALLAAALDRVPLPRRAVLIMHDLDDVPVEEVARRLSITRFGTYARLRKARKELASAVRRLSKEGVSYES